MAANKTAGKNVKLAATAEYFDNLSRFIFALAAGILMLLAIVLTCDAVAQFVNALIQDPASAWRR